MEGYLGEVRKRVAEKLPVSVDFTNRLPSGATVSSILITAKKTIDGSSISSVITGSSLTGNIASVFVTAGTSKEKYKINFSATLSDTSIMQEDILLTIV